jgi:transposase
MVAAGFAAEEMLRMDQVHVIRHKVLVEGASVRRVARELGVSRNTVKRYLSGDTPIGRRKETPRPEPKRTEVRTRLAALLEESKGWAQGKQRPTAARLHQMLREAGLGVGYTLVKDELREWKRQRQEVFVPLVYKPGDLGEVDFFEVFVDIGNERRKAWMFVLRLMHSGRDFAWLYPRQDQVCFLDGHVRAFSHLGAVPQRLLYDNLKPAVAKVLVGAERRLTARFTAIAAHYVFEPCFARPRTGHDKGGVEARGGAIRRQQLVPIPQGESLDEISGALLARLDQAAEDKRDHDGRSVMERFSDEVARMLPLPRVAFDPSAPRMVCISRRSLVKLEGATYSVPCAWAGLDATAYVGVNHVEIAAPSNDGTRVRHTRQRFGGRAVDYRHYLPELARKPAALRQVAEELVPTLGAPFTEVWEMLLDERGAREGARVFARVLDAVVEHGVEVTATRLRTAIEHKTPLQLALVPPVEVEATIDEGALPSALQNVEVLSGRASDYDALLGGAL